MTEHEAERLYDDAERLRTALLQAADTLEVFARSLKTATDVKRQELHEQGVRIDDRRRRRGV